VAVVGSVAAAVDSIVVAVAVGQHRSVKKRADVVEERSVVAVDADAVVVAVLVAATRKTMKVADVAAADSGDVGLITVVVDSAVVDVAAVLEEKAARRVSVNLKGKRAEMEKMADVVADAEAVDAAVVDVDVELVAGTVKRKTSREATKARLLLLTAQLSEEGKKEQGEQEEEGGICGHYWFDGKN